MVMGICGIFYYCMPNDFIYSIESYKEHACASNEYFRLFKKVIYT